MTMLQRQLEDFTLLIDLLPLRLRGLAATESPVGAAAIGAATVLLEERAAALGRMAYILAEHEWDLAIVEGFLLEARRRCRRVEVERLLNGHPELAALATVYLEDRDERGHRQRELFWVEEESRLVAA